MDELNFGEHARVEGTHWWFTGRRVILAALANAASGGHPGPLVDLGCGTGGNAAAFAAAGYDVIGIDPAPAAIAFARQRFPGVRFELSADPAVASGHLDAGGILLLTDVLEHVEDDRDLLARAIDSVPSGGHLVLTVPADPELWSPHDVAFGHVRRYRTDDFSRLWRNAPVEVRLFSHFNARLRPMIAMIRRMQRGRAARPGGDLRIPAGPLNVALHQVFAGEARPLVDAFDSGTAPYRRGVSLVAVLRRT